MSNALRKFHKQTSVSKSGEIMVNAGLYSRGAVVAAFEMLGGVRAFAEWADDNKSEFYTKLFGKVIGREVEHKKADDLEDILDTLDGDFEEVDFEDDAPISQASQNTARTEPKEAPVEDYVEPINSLRLRLAQAAEEYTSGEYEE